MAEYTSFSLYLNQIPLRPNEEFYGTKERTIALFDKLEPREIERIITAFREYSGDARWALYSNGAMYEQSRWSNYTAELCNFSKRHPEVMFILVGRTTSASFIILANNGKYVRSDSKIIFNELIPAMSDPALWKG